jgi:hypothetical protein
MALKARSVPEPRKIFPAALKSRVSLRLRRKDFFARRFRVRAAFHSNADNFFAAAQQAQMGHKLGTNSWVL